MIPESGGEYPYILAAFGKLSAYLYAWMTVIVMKPASSAIITQAFAIYCVKPFFDDELLKNDEDMRYQVWLWETGITLFALGKNTKNLSSPCMELLTKVYFLSFNASVFKSVLCLSLFQHSTVG